MKALVLIKQDFSKTIFLTKENQILLFVECSTKVKFSYMESAVGLKKMIRFEYIFLMRTSCFCGRETQLISSSKY